MAQYRIEISDRERARNVQAGDARDAIATAVGSRLLHARHDCDSVDRNGRVQYSRFEAAVQTGRTVGGATPFRNIWVTVTRL